MEQNEAIEIYKNLKFDYICISEEIKFLRRCKQHNVIPSSFKITTPINTSILRVVIETEQQAWLDNEIKSKLKCLEEINFRIYSQYHELPDEFFSFNLRAELPFSRIENLCKQKEEEERRRLHNEFQNILPVQNEEEPNQNIINIVHNFSSEQFSQEQITYLNRGFEYRPIPPEAPLDEIIVCIEAALKKFKIKKIIQEIIRDEIEKVITNNANNLNVNEIDKRILSELQEKDVYYVKAYNGNEVVILDKEDYNDKMTEALNEDIFKKLENSISPNSLKMEIKRTLEDLVDNNNFERSTLERLSSGKPKLTPIYGLPELHENGYSLRIIRFYINQPLSKITEYLVKELKKLEYRSEFSVRNSQQFVKKLKYVGIEDNEIMITLDVEPFISSIPFNNLETQILNFLNQQEGINENQVAILNSLFKLCLNQNYFCYQNDVYQQIKGIVAGSKLSLLSAEIFMKNYENSIKNLRWFPRIWCRSENKIFAIIKRDDLSGFLNNLESAEYNLEFKLKEEENDCIPFFDLLVKRYQNKLKFLINMEVSSKQSYIKSNSFCSTQDKYSFLKYFIRRLISTPLNREDYDDEWKKILNIAQINGYSKNLCEKILYNENGKKLKLKLTSFDVEKREKYNYISIPFYPPLTNEIEKIMKRHQFNLTFSSPGKISDILQSTKDDISDIKKSGVYSIDCLGQNCGLIYIGQTSRTLEEREKEHRNQNEGSPVSKHRRDANHEMKQIKLLKHVKNKGNFYIWESFHLDRNRHRSLMNKISQKNLSLRLSKFCWMGKILE